jgi:hypothetical protein
LGGKKLHQRDIFFFDPNISAPCRGGNLGKILPSSCETCQRSFQKGDKEGVKVLGRTLVKKKKFFFLKISIKGLETTNFMFTPVRAVEKWLI